jgi:very-short-patch-repair endonuclease
MQPDKSPGEAMLALHIRAYGLPEPIFDEVEPIPGRKFRFDFAWPEHRLAVEVQGGSWTGKGHTGGLGYADDCRKLNLAQLNGWRVLWYTTEQVENATAIDELVKFFGGLIGGMEKNT